ncbi:membrane protein DedA, SNARE-associated domain [Tessaracoccus oleiagri]|uniref:Membrane protein DedA, SNARE-associated domain n=1 Tax=Tessaracoccus oleiagri TaxID=686624 RepID=A0A1G9IJU6_9ACTN|nr:membrane protein DedA, SNARE-associated domain [Tessaracoccus oleiagri]
MQPVTSPDEHAETPAEREAEEPSATPAAEEKPWWDDEGMPWKQQPTRADYWCLGWFMFIGVFSLILIPTRAWMIAAAPDWLAILTGGRTATAASGALAAVGQMPHWPWVLVAASIMSLKFDWVYWWAGKLWGRGMIEIWAGRSKRAQRNYARAERWAEKLGPIGFFIAYIPMPLPLMQVVFVLAGAQGMSIKRFLVYDYIASTAFLVFYFWLGWSVGEPAVDLLNWYARIAGYVAIGLIVVIMFSTYFTSKKKVEASQEK